MQEWTLFVDESGLFEYDKNRSLPRGLRLVGGVLVPLNVDAAEKAARATIENGLKKGGAEWWHGPIHATELGFPPKLAGLLRRQSSVPREIAALADIIFATNGDDNRNAGRKLSDFGWGLLNALRLSVGNCMVEQQGFVVGVAEYGEKVGKGAMVARARYVPMLHALIKTCLLKIGSANGPKTHLAAVIASRGHERISFQNDAWIRAVSIMLKHDVGGRTGSFEAVFKRADDVSGLQTADIVVHALGPGREFELMPRPDEIAHRTMFNVKFEADRKLGCGRTAYEEYDALDAHQCLKNAVERFGSGNSLIATRDELSKLALQRPPGIYPAAIQQTTFAIDSLEVKR